MTFEYRNGTIADMELPYAAGKIAEEIRKHKVKETLISISRINR